MALPADWTMVEVRGQYIGLSGSPMVGTVTFTPNPTRLTDPDSYTTIITRNPIVATLDANGAFAVEVPTSDDPDIVPTGFTWHVVESFGDSYDIVILEADAALGLELSTVAPSLPSTGVVAPAVSRVEYDALIASKGQINGLAELDGDGTVPLDQLPAGIGGGTGADPDAVKLTGDQTIAGVKTFSSTPVVPDASWTIAKTTGLQAALDAKADNSGLVHTTGAETVAGVKTFSSAPSVPDNSWAISKTAGLQSALDAKLESGSVVLLTGNQTIGGTKSFSVAPVVPDASWSIAKTSGLQAALDSKASSAGVVTLDTIQTFTAVKTFSAAPVVPANAFGQDRISGLVTALAAKAPLASPTFTGTVAGITKAMVGLGNVSNLAPADLGISSAVQTELDDLTSEVSGKAAIFWRTWSGSSWSARPTGIPAGVPCFCFSTHDVAATAPSATNVNGDVWIRHPEAV